MNMNTNVRIAREKKIAKSHCLFVCLFIVNILNHIYTNMRLLKFQQILNKVAPLIGQPFQKFQERFHILFIMKDCCP